MTDGVGKSIGGGLSVPNVFTLGIYVMRHPEKVNEYCVIDGVHRILAIKVLQKMMNISEEVEIAVSLLTVPKESLWLATCVGESRRFMKCFPVTSFLFVHFREFLES